MSLRALKFLAVVVSLVACANEMQEVGAPQSSSGGSGNSNGTGGTDSGESGSGSGATGSGASTGSGAGPSTGSGAGPSTGGTAGQSGAFGGSAGLPDGGSSGGSAGGSAGGSGGSDGDAGSGGSSAGTAGSGGSGGSGSTVDCSKAPKWVSGSTPSPVIKVGEFFVFENKLYEWKGNAMGTGDLNYFHPDCPPEGTQQMWCPMQYVYELVGPCD